MSDLFFVSRSNFGCMSSRLIVPLLFLILVGCNKKQPIGNNTSSSSNELINKYAEKLKVNSSDLSNHELYQFIDNWEGTKYRFGGMSKEGVDCSGFCNILYNNVYNKQLPRMTSDIAKELKAVNKKELSEGDLVFFNISGKRNSHVGVYLINDYFVHASTSKGVIVSNLTNPYYQKAFSKGGKI